MTSRTRRRLRAALAPTFVGAGVLHFTHTEVYERIMPPYLPAHRELVLVSGVAEVAGGVGVLVPGLRRAAGLGLVALLVAVFPANLHMALHPEEFRGIPPAALWGRLPLQAVAIAWVLAATRE